MSDVALLLAGRLGEYVDCIDNILQTIVMPNDADIYVCTFDQNNSKELSLYGSKLKKLILISEEPESPKNWKNSIYQMHYKINNCFNMLDKKYKWVIKFRPDCKLDRRLDLSLLDNDVFNIPTGGDWVGGLNDVMCVSNYDNMNYYCNLINSKVNLIHDHPENLLKLHLQNKKIKRFNITVLLRKLYLDLNCVADRQYNV